MKKKDRDIEHVADFFIRLGFTLEEFVDIITMYAIADRIKILQAISRMVR